jgi:hypothetical protein
MQSDIIIDVKKTAFDGFGKLHDNMSTLSSLGLLFTSTTGFIGGTKSSRSTILNELDFKKPLV